MINLGDLAKTVLKHCATGADGETYAFGRIIGLLWGLMLVVVILWMAFVGKITSIADVGGGLGLAAAGIGALLKLNETQEPKDKDKGNDKTGGP